MGNSGTADSAFGGSLGNGSRCWNGLLGLGRDDERLRLVVSSAGFPVWFAPIRIDIEAASSLSHEDPMEPPTALLPQHSSMTMLTQTQCLALMADSFVMMALPYQVPSAEAAPTPSLQQALAQIKVPPDWMATTPSTWDTNKPWKDARLEIRRLLALEDASVRQGDQVDLALCAEGRHR